MSDYYEVRCPNRILNKKTGKEIKCNHLCLKAGAGSVGQVKCRYCGNIFNFLIDPTTKNQLSVKVNSEPRKTDNSV